MSLAPELRAVAGRTDALALLRQHADLGLCDVAVFDHDGAPLGGGGGALADARPVAVGTSVRVDGRADAQGAPVQVFDRLVGFVVAAPRSGSRPDGAPSAVATRGARLLSDLCTREYELNDLSQEILGAYEELNLFYELSADFAGAPDPESIARVITGKAARVMPAARAWVLLADPKTGALRPVSAHEAPEGAGDLAPDQGAAGRAIASRQPEVVDDVAALPEGALAGWERCALRSLLTVPIRVLEREDRPVLGVLQVVGRAQGRAFTSGDLKLASALASHAAVLIENQRLIAYEREMRIARSIQQSLLPQTPPNVRGLDVAGRCVAALSVGGDYYDHFTTEGGALALVVADVSGHDLAAALLQTAARSTLRAQAAASSGPAAILAGANRVLFEDLSRADMFLTAWFATVDPRTGRVVHADAGHVPSLLFRARSRAVTEVASGGPPIGVLPDSDYVHAELTLQPGDVLVVVTDGLTEARSPVDGEEFGFRRLATALRAAASLDADGIADALLEAVAAFDGGGPAPDDRSLLVVKMRDGTSR